jgi:hypothetical protein
VGARTSLGGFDLNASATWKLAVEPVGNSDAEALELTGQASRRLGPVTARATVTWSPDDLGSTRRSTYAEGQLGYSLGGGRSLIGAVGRRERGGGPDYTAFNIGATQTIAEHFTLDLRWYDTDRSSLGFAYRGRLIAAVRARF